MRDGRRSVWHDNLLFVKSNNFHGMFRAFASAGEEYLVLKPFNNQSVSDRIDR